MTIRFGILGSLTAILVGLCSIGCTEPAVDGPDASTTTTATVTTTTTTPLVDEDRDGVDASLDCDDADPNSYPGAPELCDGVVNDCDGRVEGGPLPEEERDVDGDGFVACSPTVAIDDWPTGPIRGGRDCNDLASSCTTDCDDDDLDGHMDCIDLCFDVDYDDFGVSQERVIVGVWADPVGDCSIAGKPCELQDTDLCPPDCSPADPLRNAECPCLPHSTKRLLDGQEVCLTQERLAAVDYHTCRIAPPGEVRCWGQPNTAVDLPNLDTSNDFVQVDTSNWHTCALRQDGSLKCWGDDYTGAVVGPNTSSHTDYVQVVTGQGFTCGLRASGATECWGRSWYDVVSDVNGSGIRDIVQVATAGDHLCGAHQDGSLTCWGRDDQGQITQPNANAGTSNVQAATSSLATCVQKAQGTAECWGPGVAADAGKLVSRIEHLSVGVNHICAVNHNFEISCEGDDGFNQVSDPIADPGADFVQVAVGRRHTCGLRTDETVTCWGDNSSNQLVVH